MYNQIRFQIGVKHQFTSPHLLFQKDTNSTKDLAENLKRDVTATFGGVNNTLIEINAVNVDLAAKAIERVSKHAAKSEEVRTCHIYLPLCLKVILLFHSVVCWLGG